MGVLETTATANNIPYHDYSGDLKCFADFDIACDNSASVTVSGSVYAFTINEQSEWNWDTKVVTEETNGNDDIGNRKTQSAAISCLSAMLTLILITQ